MNDNYSSLEQGYRGLFDVKMSELLGGSGTAQNQCMIYVVEQFMKEMHKFTESVFIYCCIENLPERILDYLATEWDIPYYEDSLDKATKVRLVKEGFKWRKTAGTTQGVKDLAEKMFGHAEISEWDEYGGTPGYFKISTNASIDGSITDFFNTLLKKQKNARSWIDSVEIIRESQITTGGAFTKFRRYLTSDEIAMSEAPRRLVRFDMESTAFAVPETVIGDAITMAETQ